MALCFLLLYEFNNGKRGKEPVSISFFFYYLHLIGVSKTIVFCFSRQAEGGHDLGPFVSREVDNSIMEAEARIGQCLF